MNLLIRELKVNDLDNLPEIDDSFIVNSRLILSLSKVNKRIEYTVEDVPSYEKSYLQDQYDDELAYTEYINKPDQVIYIAILYNQIIGVMVLKKNWNHYTYIEDIKVDKKLGSNTEYTNIVKAVDAAGNISKESEALVIKTTEEKPDTEAPTQPRGLHSMGTTTNTIDLMWSPSKDNIDVDHYIVYRKIAGYMKKIGTVNTASFMDKNLQVNTAYKYVVFAVDTSGNESMKRDALTITIKSTRKLL